VLYHSDIEECFGSTRRYFEANFWNTTQKEWEKIYQDFYEPFNEDEELKDKIVSEKIVDEDEADSLPPGNIPPSSPSVVTTYAGLLIDDSSFDEEPQLSDKEFADMQNKLVADGIIPPPHTPPTYDSDSDSDNDNEDEDGDDDGDDEDDDDEEIEEPSLKKHKKK